jgi:hypothetical protein
MYTFLAIFVLRRFTEVSGTTVIGTTSNFTFTRTKEKNKEFLAL